MIEVVFTVGTYRGDCSLDSWTSAVAAHVVYKHIRRRKIERRIFGRLDVGSPRSTRGRRRERAAKRWFATRCGACSRTSTRSTRSRRGRSCCTTCAATTSARSRASRASSAAAAQTRLDSRAARGARAHRRRIRSSPICSNRSGGRDERTALRSSREHDALTRRLRTAPPCAGPRRPRAGDRGDRARHRDRAAAATVAPVARAVCAAAAAVVLTGVRGVPARGATARRSPSRPAASRSVAQIVAHPVSGGSSVVVSGAQAPLDDGRLLGPGQSRGHAGERSRHALVLDGEHGLAPRRYRHDRGGRGSHAATRSSTRAPSSCTSRSSRRTTGSSSPRPDSEVEVRGTRFSVSRRRCPIRGAAPELRTRVAVTEGVVVVRHAGIEDRVAIGRAVAAAAACARRGVGDRGAPGHEPAADRRVAPSTGLHSRGSERPLRRRRPPPSVAATRAARWRRSIASSRSYPASPLAESATVERMRVLRDAWDEVEPWPPRRTISRAIRTASRMPRRRRSLRRAREQDRAAC